MTPMRRADGERADVAHEHLRGIRVEPQEAEARARERRAEDEQLAGVRNRRNRQVVREHRVAARVREHAERRGDERRRHDGEAIEPVGEIHRVAHADDHEIRDRDEAERGQRRGERP